VQHAVDRLADLEVLHEIVLHEHEALVAKVLDVRQRPRLEVVDAEHAVTAAEQCFTEVGAEESGPAGDDRRGNVSVLSRDPSPSDLYRMLATLRIQAAARKPATIDS
jgi:hypothetical protein